MTYQVRRKSAERGKSHTYETSAPNAYPAGSVPKETGYGARDISSGGFLPNHNRITVCRPKKG